MGVVAAVCAAFLSAPLWQSDEGRATQVVTHGAPAAAPYASATLAYREGATALASGKLDDALPKLIYAAERGVLGAQLRLARHYRGDNAETSFRYFSLIADQHADILPSSPVAHYVTEAFVAVGDALRAGIPGHIEANSRRAASIYFHAASYFGAPEAQYRLATMTLAGDGMARDVRVAVKWLANAAKKHHAPSQALLGDIVWRGDVAGAPRTTGLALMIAAHDVAGTPDEDAAWIVHLRDRALASASADVTREAKAIASAWQVQSRIDLGIDAHDAEESVEASIAPASAEFAVPASEKAVITR